MEPKILVKPTEKQYQVLQDAFDYFNEKLFKDSLPQVMLTLNRERNTFGYYVPSIWTDDKGVEQWGEIALNPDYILKEGKRTGQHVTHYIVEGGPFDLAFQAMPKELLIPCHTLFALKGEAKKKKIKKARPKSVTYFCPKCGATVKGKENTNVLCGDCMEKMLVKTGKDK